LHFYNFQALLNDGANACSCFQLSISKPHFRSHKSWAVSKARKLKIRNGLALAVSDVQFSNWSLEKPASVLEEIDQILMTIKKKYLT
jgi:hypothetical protein